MIKKFYFLCFLIFGSVHVLSQSLYEDFNYTLGGNIGGSTAGSGTTNNNWTTHSNSQVGTINVLAGSLSYAGLQTSNGNRVVIPGNNATVPRDVNRNAGFGATNSVVYFSFLLNIVNGTQLGATHTGNGYFIHFGTASGTSAGSFFGRVSARTSGAGFRLGIGDFANTFTDWGSDLSFGTTYLVVVKYDLVGTATADIASMWINPAALGGAEPGGSITNSFSAGDVATNISNAASIAVRNSSATPNAEIDEIRVGTTWAQVTPVAGGPTINLSATTLTGFTALSGVPSAEQNYSVDGSALTANIDIVPPAGFEISPTTAPFTPTNPITLTQVGGVVNSTTIYVRMNSTTLGTNTGNITHTSAGSNNPNVALTGHVITTEPTTQGVISIPVSSITTMSMVVNFTSGDGAKRILLAKALTPVDSNPVDGTTYTANANFGSGTQIGTGNYVLYAGTGNTVTVTGLSPSTLYNFAVYEYNDAAIAGAENYLTTSPGLGFAITLSTDGDFRSVTSGNWSDPATWQIRVGGLWIPAVAVTPLPISNVYVQLGHTVAVDITTATCNDLHINSGALTQLSIGANTVEVNGKLRAYTGAAFTALGVDAAFYTGQSSTSTVGSNCITSTALTGKMKFVGITRVITNTGEWGNNPSGWDVEFAPNAGQTLTVQTGFKATNIIVATGTLVSTATDMRPDGGSAGLGRLKVKSGSTLQFTNNAIAIQRIGTPSPTSHFGTIIVEPGATLEFSGTSSPVIGASVVNFSGTVIYSGAGNQTFAAKGGNSLGVDIPDYNNVTISGGGNKTLAVATTLSGVLNLISGYVISTTNLLNMTPTSSVSNASNASFVNGPVSKFGGTAFIFPVGKPNCGPSATVNGYVPIEISTFSAGAPTDQYIAEYIRASGAALPGGISATGLAKVSNCEYWNLDRLAGTGTVNVKLFWNEPINNCTTASPYIILLDSLVVAHYNGTSWNSYGTTLTATGSAASGNVTWPNVSIFSPFTIGTVDFINPLPITINYFNGYKNNGNHLLNWKVTCVSTPSATIQVERSTDGRNYSSIYSIFATALRCQQPFDYTDNQPAEGTNYYRLKMTDADGKITYSNIVPLINAAKGTEMMNIVPNPIVNGGFNLKISTAEKTQMELVIIDMQGRVLQKQTVSMIAGFNTVPVNVRNLAAGTYQLFGNTKDERTRVLRFVIQ